MIFLGVVEAQLAGSIKAAFYGLTVEASDTSNAAPASLWASHHASKRIKQHCLGNCEQGCLATDLAHSRGKVFSGPAMRGNSTARHFLEMDKLVGDALMYFELAQPKSAYPICDDLPIPTLFHIHQHQSYNASIPCCCCCFFAQLGVFRYKLNLPIISMHKYTINDIISTIRDI